LVLVLESVFQVVIKLFEGRIPLESLLGLLVLEEFVPVLGLLELLVIFR
jgi:hypothetical protein